MCFFESGLLMSCLLSWLVSPNPDFLTNLSHVKSTYQHNIGFYKDWFLHPIIPWSMKCGKYTFKGLRYLWILHVKYITHCISDHKFCQDPCSLVTTVASDNRNRWGLLSLGMQGFDRLVSSNRRSCRGTISSCVKPKTSIQQTYFDPTATEPGSWKDSSILYFSPEKYTQESESSSLGGGTFMGSPSWNIFEIQNLISKKQLKLESEMRQWMSSSPQNLQTRGHHLSPFDQILGISIWKTSCAYQHQPLLLALTAEARNRRWKLFGAHHLGFQSLWPVFGAWKLFRKEGACGLRQKKTNYKIHIDLLYPREPFQNTSSVLWA